MMERFSLSSDLAIDNLPLSSEMVHPNPSNGLFNLVVNGIAKEQIVISIWDLKGKQVLHKDLTQDSKSEVHQLSIENQPSGLNLIRVTGGCRQKNTINT